MSALRFSAARLSGDPSGTKIPPLSALLRYVPYIFLLSIGAAWPAAAQVRIGGTVSDEETGALLSGAHVFTEDMAQGAITNAEGRFVLELPALPEAIIVQHLGYAPRAFPVSPEESESLVIRLTPIVIPLEEALVSGEGFASGLMQQVIRRKQRMFAEITSLGVAGQTRMTLERDDRIVHLGDTAFDLLWIYGDAGQTGPAPRTHRVRVSAVSRTGAWDEELPLPAPHDVPNLYEDFATIQGQRMIGPTHPDALEHYVFRVAAERTLGDRTIYDLNVSPIGEEEAAFIGQISVMDEEFVMLEARLFPARHVVFPAPTSGWNVRYAQHFREVDGGFWAPVNLDMEGTLRAAVNMRSLRTVRFNRRTLLTWRQTNVPEEQFESATTVWNDPHFRYGQILMPMTARELDAIADLRAANLTLSEAFPAERRAGRFIGFLDPEIPDRLQWPVVMGYRFKFRYNRVDGLLSSVGNELDLFSGILMSWRLGQATGLEQIRRYVSLARPLGARGLLRVSYDRDVASQGVGSGHSEALASVQAALGGEDYFDYFRRTRYGAGMEATWRGLHFAAGVEQEKAESIARQATHSWPYAQAFRDNPAIRDGTFRSAYAALALPVRANRTIRSAALRVEHGSPQRLAGAAAFTLLGGHIDLTQPTLHRRRPTPAGLHIRLQARTSFGDLPPQRTAMLDTGLELFGGLRLNRRHAFRSLHGRPLQGAQYAAVFWRHEFTTLPFEWVRLWPLVRLRMGIALFGAHGRVWGQPDAPGHEGFSCIPPGYCGDNSVHEVGVSLTRIGGTPLRLDITRRLGDSEEFSGSRVVVGFGVEL